MIHDGLYDIKQRNSPNYFEKRKFWTVSMNFIYKTFIPWDHESKKYVHYGYSLVYLIKIGREFDTAEVLCIYQCYKYNIYKRVRF